MALRLVKLKIPFLNMYLLKCKSMKLSGVNILPNYCYYCTKMGDFHLLKENQVYVKLEMQLEKQINLLGILYVITKLTIQ